LTTDTTDTSDTATILIVPGLRDHVPGHWQTLLQAQLEREGRKVACVPRRTDAKLSCEAWVEDIQTSLVAIAGPVVVVAHSGGVAMVAHWAQRYRRVIRGALLATPADLERPLPPGYPTEEALRQNGWLPLPRQPLPFPSIVAASTNDPLGQFDRIAGLARDWGSRLVSLGEVGHLNPASGYGTWPGAQDLIARLTGPPPVPTTNPG
jgi:predicted alpha/beta hydrolase family esterase